MRSYYRNADEGVDSILLQEVVDAHGMIIDRIVSKVTNNNGIALTFEEKDILKSNIEKFYRPMLPQILNYLGNDEKLMKQLRDCNSHVCNRNLVSGKYGKCEMIEAMERRFEFEDYKGNPLHFESVFIPNGRYEKIQYEIRISPFQNRGSEPDSDVFFRNESFVFIDCLIAI